MIAEVPWYVSIVVNEEIYNKRHLKIFITPKLKSYDDPLATTRILPKI